MTKFLMVAAITMLLSGCGGGGSGSSVGTGVGQPPPPPPTRSAPLQYGYFALDQKQISETADHVTYIMTPDWGDWDNPQDVDRINRDLIGYLQEAKARGVNKAILSVGHLLWHPGASYTPKFEAEANLKALRANLMALDLDSMVIGLYPVDEPELKGLNDKVLSQVLINTKQAWGGTKLFVIYGDTHSYPGLQYYNVIGKDKYGSGANVLNEYPPIVGDQQYWGVPGGWSVNMNDPQPFLEWAKSNTNVWGLCVFVWMDSEFGAFKGVRSDGLASQYRNVGLYIKGLQ